jgi:dethiobiotin synthetase
MKRTTQTIFVTATDTGVGKTVVTAALAVALRGHGQSVGVMKPVETGVGKSRRSDAARLVQAAQVRDPQSLVTPYSFRLPVAPRDAARAERRTIHLSTVRDAVQKLQTLHDYLLVEGVGGLHVPLTAKADVLDLIELLDVPAIVVGHAALGGVNHALLTLHALRRRKIPILAMVMNRSAPARTSLARRQERSTVRLIREHAGVPVIGPLPHVPKLALRFDQAVSKMAADDAMQELTKMVLASA